MLTGCDFPWGSGWMKSFGVFILLYSPIDYVMQVPGGWDCIAPLLQLWLQTLRIQFTLSVELSLLWMGLPCSILHPWWPVVTSTPPILTTHMHQSSSYSSSAIPHLSITISQVCKVHAFICQTLIFCSARQPLIRRHTFRVAVPTIWYSLPLHICQSQT